MTNEQILACKNGMYDACYAQAVNQKIRCKYSLSQELAILRQRDEKPQEFEEYNTYAQTVKAEVKAEFARVLDSCEVAVNETVQNSDEA